MTILQHLSDLDMKLSIDMLVDLYQNGNVQHVVTYIMNRKSKREVAVQTAAFLDELYSRGIACNAFLKALTV